MEHLLTKVAEIETKTTAIQGLAEIALSLIVSINGKEKFISDLHFITKSDQFSVEAKSSAKELLSQEELWGKQLESGLKQ